MPLTPPPPTITGTILSMAHANGNKWVDEISGVKWTQRDYATDLDKFSISDKNSAINGKPYIALTGRNNIYTVNLADNISDTEDFTYFIRYKAMDSRPFILICTSCQSWTEDPGGLAVLYAYYNWGLGFNDAGTSAVKPVTPAPINSWNAITLTRKNGIGYLFINGQLKASDQVQYLVVKKHQIGTTDGHNYPGSATACYDEIVLIKGQALWTENFDSDINWGYKWKALSDREGSSFKLY